MIPLCILAIEDESDREFMVELYEEYKLLMYKEINRITRDAWDAEDIMQTALVKLIDRIALLRTLERNRLVNYIITAVKHNAYNYLSRQKKNTFSFDDLRDTPMDIDMMAGIEERLDTKEDLKRLFTIWPRLEKRSRYLLEAKYILDEPSEDIARVLGIQARSVRMALTRARRQAYDLIQEEKAGRR